MRGVKGGSRPVEQKPNPRAISIVALSPHGHKERLDVLPGDIFPNRIGKDGFQGFAVFAVHINIVSPLDTICKLDFLMQYVDYPDLEKTVPSW